MRLWIKFLGSDFDEIKRNIFVIFLEISKGRGGKISFKGPPAK